jgi:penicillin-binding protein 2
VDDDDTLVCPGIHEQGKRTFRCTSSHGRIGLLDAIQHSCNVFFWKLSERIGLDRIAEVATDFGLGQPTGLGLNGDVSGRIPTRAWYDERDVFKIGYTLNTATGQGDVEVTVLQMALAYATIANGGKLFAPQIVDRIESAAGEVVARYEPSLRRTVKISESSLSTLRRGMWMVVNTAGGTAYDARSDKLEFAGKTGTAQVRNRRQKDSELVGWHPHRDHAWFAGFAPAVNPEIAVVVLIEHGGPGGKVAGPVARDIIEGYFDQGAKP